MKSAACFIVPLEASIESLVRCAAAPLEIALRFHPSSFILRMSLAVSLLLLVSYRRWTQTRKLFLTHSPPDLPRSSNYDKSLMLYCVQIVNGDTMMLS